MTRIDLRGSITRYLESLPPGRGATNREIQAAVAVVNGKHSGTGAIGNILNDLEADGLVEVDDSNRTYVYTWAQGAVSRRDQVQALVSEHLDSQGVPPSSREIMRLMGRHDDRSIRKDWDELTAEGKLPPRPEPVKSGMTGRLLSDAEGKLRAVLREIENADPGQRNATREFLVHRLDIIAGLTEKAMAMVIDDALDTAIRQIIEHQ